MISLLVIVLPLAVVDAVSVGAMAIPVWFLLLTRVRHGYVILYLVALAAAYAALGIVVLNGPTGLRADAQEYLDSALGGSIRGVVGVVVLLFAAWYGLVHEADVGKPGAGLLGKWRNAAVGEHAYLRATIGVALFATVLEIPTAVPYALALTRVDEADQDATTQVAVVGAYAAIMILPALALTVGSVFARRHVAGVLHRVDQWFRANAQENTAWLIGFVGVALFFDTPLYHSMMDLVSNTTSPSH